MAMNYTSEVMEVAHSLGAESRLDETRKYMQHGRVSVYEHCINVAEMSCAIADHMKIDVRREEMIRGALLHDYFLYDWHHKDDGTHNWHGFKHAYTALKNAREDFKLTKVEEDIIVHHMFPLNITIPISREARIVCLADKLCAIKDMTTWIRSARYGNVS